MDDLESLFHDISTINSNIQAQDVRLAKALRGYSSGKPTNSKSKPKLTKSRGALPIPSQRMSKSKLPTKPSMKKIPSSKSRVLINRTKSTKIMIKKKPALPPTIKSSRNLQEQSKPGKKPPLPPRGGVKLAPVKRALTFKEAVPTRAQNQQQSQQHHTFQPVPPVSKKPATLTDSSANLRHEFQQHMDDIEKLKELLSDSKEEGQVLQEMNGVVSILLNKSQGYLSKADNSLRTANAEAPVHYKNIIRKLLDNQSKTTIIVSPKPVSRKIPIYKKLQIEYTDRAEKDLDDLLKKHPSNSYSGSSKEFNFPDIFDRIYNKSLPDTNKQRLKPQSENSDFDLTMYSPAKLIERAQKSLTSTMSSDALSSFRRDQSLPGYSSERIAVALSPTRAPLHAEKDLDTLVQEVLNKVSHHSNRIEEYSTSALLAASPLSLNPQYLQDNSVESNAALTDPLVGAETPTKFPSIIPTIDDDLAMLTPSLFNQKPTTTASGEVQKSNSAAELQHDKETEFEMDLIRTSNRSERERIRGQMDAMRSKLDNLINTSSSNASAVSNDDDSSIDSNINVEELLPKLVGQMNMQSKDNDSKMNEHEDMLQKVVRALMKKNNKQKDKDKSEERRARRISKLEQQQERSEDGESETKAVGNSNSTNKLIPAPPSSQRSSQTPRTKKIARASSNLSTMHEEDDEADEESERSSFSRKDANKGLFAGSKPTEKSLAAVEAVKERTKHFDSTRPTEVDMKF